MRIFNLTLMLCFCVSATLCGQQTAPEIGQSATPGLVRVAASSPTPGSGIYPSSRRTQEFAQPLIESASAQQWGYEPAPTVPVDSLGIDYANRLSYNATNPKSRLLLNPDQFWTRKTRAVIDQHGVNLFGDPNCACDEWRGFCGCCGLKSNPGHLGIRSLQGGEACECVDAGCPAPGCGKCARAQCR